TQSYRPCLHLRPPERLHHIPGRFLLAYFDSSVIFSVSLCYNEISGKYLNPKPRYLQEASSVPSKQSAVLRRFLFRLFEVPMRLRGLLAAREPFEQVAVGLAVVNVLSGLLKVVEFDAEFAVAVQSRVAQIEVSQAGARPLLGQIFQPA